MLAVAALKRVCPLAVVVAALAVLAPAALADGDPASDFLLSQSSFLSPYDGKIPTSQQERIEAMLQSAKEQGFPLKLAVIVTRYDLGAVPILYRKPQTYAKFLAQEDFYFWKDELLVVMPNGYGLYKLKGLPPGRQGADREAAEAGHDRRPGARDCSGAGDHGARCPSRAHPRRPEPGRTAPRCGSNAARSPAARS